MLLSPQEWPAVFAEREIVPEEGPGREQPRSRGSRRRPVSRNVWESCLCSPWYYCTVLSPLLLSHCSWYCCSPWTFPPFPPFYFFFPLHFVHWVWYAVLFFSLSLSLTFFLLSFWLALSLCMLHTIPPRKGTCLIPYHCWSRNLWKESWSWWTTCQALCAIIMPSQLPNITTLRTRLIFLISCKVSIQTQFDWDL